MKCLIATFSFDTCMDNYFTSFRLITHNIWATGVHSLRYYANAVSLAETAAKKRETWLTHGFKQRTSSKKALKLWQWLARTKTINLKTKLKESIFKNNNQIMSPVTSRRWALLTEWTRTLPNTGLVSEWKNTGGPRLFEW